MGFLSFITRFFSKSPAGGDKTLRCVECGGDFLFEAGEQAFFRERGFQEPKRCPRCRKQQRRGRSRGRR